MRIVDVKATPVSIPTTRTSAWSQGRGSGISRTIVEVTTDRGLTGLGETFGAAAADIINHRFAPRLRGLPALEHATLARACLPGHRDFASLSQPALHHAYAAVEIASWDLRGKALGEPLFRLLGGAVRDRGRFGAYAYTVALEDGFEEADVPGVMAEIARDSVSTTGSSTFELKVGRHSLECDIATIHAVRAAVGPRVELGVDANMALDMDQARRLIRETRAARLDNFEEPVPTLTEMETLRRDCGVPISAHCTDIEKVRHYPLIDGIAADLHVDGGISGIMSLAPVIRSLGKRFWLRSAEEAGISWAAMCHLAIVLPQLDRPSQTLINWMEDDLVEGDPWLVRDGGVAPPEQPGLGVELDRPALARCAARFRERGELTHYDAP